MDCPNPDWSTAFTMDYMFEVIQEVRIHKVMDSLPLGTFLKGADVLQITVRVYHYHDGVAVTDFAKHTFIGESTFILANLMTVQDQKMSPELTGGKHT